MSEANTPTSGVDTSPAQPGSAAASLYPDGGGQGGSAAEPVAPVGKSSSAPSGADTVAGASGADSVAGTSGEDTVSGTEAGTAGEDTVAGTDGTDSLSAASYSLSLPEGFAPNDALLSEAATLFAEVGIPPDKAQSLVDLYARAATAANATATSAYQSEQTAWTTEVNAMPEFQGEARATSLQAIGRVFDEYGTPEARAALDTYGTGNNPALVKMFLKMASALSEGAPTSQGRPAAIGKDGRSLNSGRTIGQRLYPDQPTS